MADCIHRFVRLELDRGPMWCYLICIDCGVEIGKATAVQNPDGSVICNVPLNDKIVLSGEMVSATTVVAIETPEDYLDLANITNDLEDKS